MRRPSLLAGGPGSRDADRQGSVTGGGQHGNGIGFCIETCAFLKNYLAAILHLNPNQKPVKTELKPLQPGRSLLASFTRFSYQGSDKPGEVEVVVLTGRLAVARVEAVKQVSTERD